MTKRILIVDDEPNIVISLEFLMKREGHETTVAPDGEAALAAMAHERADLVILDIMLPKLNGFDVCERIRAEPAWRETKILMLTAKGRDIDLAKGLRLGADAYVAKPFSMQDLLIQVRRLLAGG